MRHTSPEQIRAVQQRSSQVLNARLAADRSTEVENRWVTGKTGNEADIRFRSASSGVDTLFTSQAFDASHRDGAVKSNNWALWWSDLMMTMFIMFAALYAFQTPKNTPPIPPQAIPLPPHEDPAPQEPVVGDSILLRTFEAAREAVHNEHMDGVVAVRLVPEKFVRISIAGDLLFDGNKSVLKSSASRPLRVLGEVLLKAPYTLSVVGHTDNNAAAAGFPSNWELSASRACAVGRFLIQDAGIDAGRMIMTGLGDQQPLFPNDSAANMAANRRIEVVVNAENPLGALAEERQGVSSTANVRQWLVKGKEGERGWNAKH